MDTLLSYVLLLGTLAFFGYVGYTAAADRKMDSDAYLSARGSQSWQRIGPVSYTHLTLPTKA